VSNRSIRLFRPFGFSVSLDPSWFVVGTLVTWSLAVGLFPNKVPGLHPAAYWMMGVAGALGLLFSIVVHELCHALVGRRFGIQLRGIRLFMFGGVAEMTQEPPSPRAEFVVAGVGPLSSLVLAGLTFGAATWLRPVLPRWAEGILVYLAGINLLLALFNLVPAFPLDGGRLLRAVLWRWQKNIRRATRITSRLGQGFGLLLVAMGVISAIKGNWVSGLWSAMIGLFLKGAAEQAYRQVAFRRALVGATVRSSLTPDPLTVGPDTHLRDVMEAFSRTHQELCPVVKEGKLLGAVTLEGVKSVPREKWDWTRVKDVIDPLTDSNTISPDADAMTALLHMQAHEATHLMVVEGGRLAGLLALRDLMAFLSMRAGLESAKSRSPDGN
jgi:Zn-dependent protease/CBS domain-containing protein